MKANKRLFLALASSCLLLSVCSCGNSGSTLNSHEVSEEHWAELFDLKILAANSNFKITCDVPVNDWHATISFDTGKMLITGMGQSSVPPGSEPVEQKDYEYIRVKSILKGIMTYDVYSYMNKWIVEQREAHVNQFFSGYGIFYLHYSDFTFNKETHLYEGTIPELNASATIEFANDKIQKISYDRNGEKIYYSFSEYDNVKVTLPEPNSVDPR